MVISRNGVPDYLFLFVSSYSSVFILSRNRKGNRSRITRARSDSPVHHMERKGTGRMARERETAAGSLTAEAAFSVPIVFMAWLAFLYFFQIIRIQEELHYAAFEAVRVAAGYGYLASRAEAAADKVWEESALSQMDESAGEDLLRGLAGDISAELFYKSMIARYLDVERINDSCIAGGFGGISAAGSTILSEGMYAEILLRYRIVLPLPLFSDLAFPVTQRIRVRSFTGEGEMPEDDEEEEAEDDEEDEPQIAYITENGEVYHISPDCTYIKISVTAAEYEDLAGLKNENGERYQACLYCSGKREPSGRIYITKYGTAYHSDLNCSRIKRVVKTIRLTEARESCRACSKCGREEKK